MKNTLNLFLLLSTSVLFTACPSSDESGKITYYFNEEIKTYVFMPVGSWWVYEDSATLDLDTVTLNFSEKNFTRDEIDDYEIRNMVFYSSLNKGEIWGGQMQVVTHIKIHIYILALQHLQIFILIRMTPSFF